MNSRLSYFTAGREGIWSIRDVREITGKGLSIEKRLNITTLPPAGNEKWTLRGIRSNERYTTTEEKSQLIEKQEDLGRPDSKFAVLIPIKKTEEWWQLSQDRRREIFEEQSKHTSTGMRYLPAIARRLYHCRDLGTNEPFDFLTWFEFSPGEQDRFDTLLSELRASLEWTFVDREVEIRLQR